MHTSKILRSTQFQARDECGHPVAVTAGLTLEDRLGIVSPRYDDAVMGASGAILAFVTAYYDLQRAREAETGQPFFIYPDYFAFFLADGGEDGDLRGQAGPAALTHGVSKAYGWLDIWPDPKWVVAADGGALWKNVLARRITHLLVPDSLAPDLAPIPDVVRASLRVIHRYLLPAETAPVDGLVHLEMAAEPAEVIARAVAFLPSESPAHRALPLTAQRLVCGRPADVTALEQNLSEQTTVTVSW